ncbi:siderophore-interacting protein [Frankia tisae]|uniref:siderophore-interacting protein n=1 Tax=Frankia tisae TaxID=2950104 RepID=UPI0021C166D5|nr:SIP domain-containing protein [Frankia tisae]
MPTMPVPLAEFAERKLGCAGTISAADRLSPGLLHLQVSCPQPRRKRWAPGQEIEFRVGTRAFRHYNVLAYDEPAGVLGVLIHLHGDGPGSTWAGGREVGEQVVVLGPGGSLGQRPAERRLLLGDATTLGTFAGMIAAGPPGFVGAVEVAAADVAAAEKLVPGLAVVPAQAEPGAALRGWLTASLADLGPVPADVAYLLGHAQTIQELRTILRSSSTLDRRAIVTKPYWSTGKAGL